ncbi:MAG: rhodanese-like domain-containing protein [Acidovorax sp.]|nr:rhodanese-like domain-containing protein [Acidovorax sp.]
MNFIIENWYLILLALASGAMLLWPVLAGGGASGLSTADAVQLINRQKAVVVDVCGPEEYAEGHVSGAKNVPLAQLQERLPTVVKNKSVPIIMVCSRGARARRAAIMAKQIGYDNAQALAGGLGAWREANLPVEKG